MMIRFIVAIDEKKGMANDHGIPWQGKLPTDVHDFRDKTQHGIVLMGYGTYKEFDAPLSDRANYVANIEPVSMREGFKLVTNARQFLQDATEDIWVIGGAGLFSQTLDLADELYITQLQGDFHCTKFFPEFENNFHLISKSDAQRENDITFEFQVWGRANKTDINW